MTFLDTAAMAVAGGFVMWTLNGAGPWEASAPATATPIPAGKVTVMGDVPGPQTQEGREAFAQFTTDAAYYGAFAVSDTGGYRFTYLYNKLEVAKADAIAFCEEENGAPCKVYAVIQPEAPQTDLPEPMSASTLEGYRDYQQTYGHGAFALSDNGAYGMTWEWDHKTGARREAMMICAGYAADEHARDAEATRCRVVASN